MFCRNCGTRISDGTNFCASCGARTETQAAAPQPKVSVALDATERRPHKKGPISALLISVAVILILLGIGQVTLGVVGSTATAQVTGYEQQYIINNDESTKNPSRYKLKYQFSVNGERYTGSVTRVFPGGSHMRQTLSVRYLPFWPHVNAEDGGTADVRGQRI